MSNKIKNSQQLQQRLRELNTKRELLEASIIRNSEETYAVFTHPGPIIKRTIRELAFDREFRSDLWQVVLSSVASYAGKKFAGSSFVKGLADSIGNSFFKEKESKTEQEHSSSESEHSEKEQTSGELFSKIIDVIRQHRKS
jgi:hypothetical protein